MHHSIPAFSPDLSLNSVDDRVHNLSVSMSNACSAGVDAVGFYSQPLVNNVRSNLSLDNYNRQNVAPSISVTNNMSAPQRYHTAPIYRSMTSDNVLDWRLHSSPSYLHQSPIITGNSFVSMNPSPNLSQMSFGHNRNNQVTTTNYAGMIENINRRNVNCNSNMCNNGTFVSNSHPYVTSIGSN